MHGKPTLDRPMNKDILLTRLSIAFCLLALALFYRDILVAVHVGDASALHGIIVGLLITALVYGSLVYLVARCGYFQRNSGSVLSTIDDLESVYATDATPPPEFVTRIVRLSAPLSVTRAGDAASDGGRDVATSNAAAPEVATITVDI